MSAHTASSSFLDTVWMRLIALLVALGGIALFVVTNQDRVDRWLSGGSDSGSPAYQQCLAERMDAVERIAAEAGYTMKQKELAQIRAVEFCRNETGG